MSKVDFTYKGYETLIELLAEQNYAFCNYHNYSLHTRCVILRHDIDNSLEAALRLGGVEERLCISSTFFILLTSNFYNPASAKNLAAIRALQGMGHEIGLHFDEMAYGGELTPEQTVAAIQKEASILADILETPVTTVSMHRPSRATLEANLVIPGIINSYGQTFFHDFKYLSDSRRCWREPVEAIIQSGEYDRLHILTHAFWYHDREETIEESVKNYIQSANNERYDQMKENITDLEAIFQLDQCRK